MVQIKKKSGNGVENPPVRSFLRRILRMGWLRLVGSLKSWVSFAKKLYERDSILPKKPIILRSLLTVATPHGALTLCVRARERECVCVCVEERECVRERERERVFVCE